MPGKSGIDRSGHITMTMSEVNFFNALARKAERADFLRNNGLMKQEVGRNPILAQKTPRKEKTFDNTVPEAIKLPERWHYPEIDWGLMAKFRSQKLIYDKLQSQENEYKEKLHESKENREAAMEFNNETINTSRGGNKISARDTNEEIITENITNRELKTTSRKDDIQYQPNQLYEQKINDFRIVGKNNPEILAKWRAKRAADFVLTQNHPLEPPTSRMLADRFFKPAGTAPGEFVTKELKIKTKSKSSKIIEPIDTARLQEKLGNLMSALDQTQSEIEKQELKIALNNKTKSYQR